MAMDSDSKAVSMYCIPKHHMLQFERLINYSASWSLPLVILKWLGIAHRRHKRPLLLAIFAKLTVVLSNGLPYQLQLLFILSSKIFKCPSVYGLQDMA